MWEGNVATGRVLVQATAVIKKKKNKPDSFKMKLLALHL